MPWPKNLKGVKYQGSGQKQEKRSSGASPWSLVETGACGSSSSSLEVSSSILIRPGGRLSVIRSYTHGEFGGVWAKENEGDLGSETLELGSSISSSVNCESVLSPVFDSIWISSIIFGSVTSECDYSVWG